MALGFFAFYVIMFAYFLAAVTAYFEWKRVNEKFMLLMLPAGLSLMLTCILLAASAGTPELFEKQALRVLIYSSLIMGGLCWITRNIWYLVRFVRVDWGKLSIFVHRITDRE